MSSPAPYVSIILIIGTQREDSERALASILSQTGLEQAEVLLYDTAGDRFRPPAGSNHPAVRRQAAQNAAPLNELRAKAVEAARGEVVAFVEQHVVVVPGWLETVIRGMRAGHAGVGGAPGSLNPGAGLSDILALINFGFFRPVAPARACSLLPANNSAYRRDVLLSFGDELPALLASEMLLDAKIVERGNTLWLDPGAKFLHLNEETLPGGARGYYYWNLIFGENRARVSHWSGWRKLVQGLATPVIPFIRYRKYMLHLWRDDRQSVPLLLRYTSVFLYIQLAAALGIAIGAWFGAGDAEMKFGNYELNADWQD